MAEPGMRIEAGAGTPVMGKDPSGKAQFFRTGDGGEMVANHSTTSIGHGRKTVTTAGTDVALAASTPAKWVTIQALRSNTANIAVGGAGVDATASTGDGVTLAAGESITLPIDNLADVYIDATVNGEGVRYTYGS